MKRIYRGYSLAASCFGDRPVHARCVRIVSGAASRCDMHTLKTDRAARGIFGASRKQRRSCGHSNSSGRLQAPRRDRAWFRALAVSYVEFMRGLGEIIQRSSRNLKRAAVVEPRCRRGHKTKTPQWLRNQDVSAAAEARRRDKRAPFWRAQVSFVAPSDGSSN